jgi:hypothetical protein
VLNIKNNVSFVNIIPLQLPCVVRKPNIVKIPLIPINSMKFENNLYAISGSKNFFYFLFYKKIFFLLSCCI